MSYARFSDGDVYVYLSIAGAFACCACRLSPDDREQRFATTDEMVAHLQEHTAAGHDVPGYCVERLKAERAENDAWLKSEAV